MKRVLPIFLASALLLTACGSSGAASPSAPAASEPAEGTLIALSDTGITVDGAAVSTDNTSAVYTANDIVYYESGKDFTYGEGTAEDAHDAAEAAAHTVVHITEPGTYTLRGTLSQGQIAVDLGEEAEDDPSACVTLVLDGADITCTVAPAVIFYNVYECGNKDDPKATVDTANAGANVYVTDSVNNISGSYVARIYKSVELSEDGTEVVDSKKLHKYDAAFYSKMSMNIDGTGTLNIDAENEGLDSELHLTVNGANINIESGNDGINTNEDGVSVTTINGGSVNILVTGETGEGDGIDSNGWLVINGGTVTTSACSISMDAGIDSDMGIYLNGGTVCAAGGMLDRIEDGSQTHLVFSFAQRQTGGSTYTLKDSTGAVVCEWSPVNDFTNMIAADAAITEGTYTLWCGDTQLAAASGQTGGRGGFGGGMRPEMPEGMEPPEDFDPESMTPPEGMERPDGEKHPGLPEGAVRNDDGTITLPDGTVIDPAEMRGERPEGTEPPEGGFGGRGGMTPTDLSTDLAIVSGANYFTVSTAE